MPTSLFTDSFTRSDVNPLAGNWTTQGGGFSDFELVSNLVYGTGTNNAVYVNSVSPNNDQYAQCKLAQILLSTTGGGPCVRMATAANTMYGVQVYGTTNPVTLEIFLFSAGSYSGLGNTTITFAPNDVIRLEVSGTTLTAYQNGVQMKQVTDATLSSGKGGLYAFGGVGGSGTKFDDVDIGNMTASFQAAWARNANQIVKAR